MLHYSFYNNNPVYTPLDIKLSLNIAKPLFIPMWVFVASGPATYIALVLHIFVCHENIKHIVHSAVSSLYSESQQLKPFSLYEVSVMLATLIVCEYLWGEGVLEQTKDIQ